MNTQGGLTAGDRLTLRAWRGANVVGWALAALVLSLFLRLGFEDGASLIGHSLVDIVDRVDYGGYALAVMVPSSVVCGCLIGSIIGARVYRRPTLVSGLVSAVYAVVVWLTMRSVDVPHPAFPPTITAAVLVLAVATAVVVGRRVAAARPSVRLRDAIE